MRDGLLVAMMPALTALAAHPCAADLDLESTSPAGPVQASIYKAQKLALIQEEREIALAAGSNRISFGWDQMKIDPSSLAVRLEGPARVTRVSFPAETPNTALWEVEAERAAACRLHIAYLAEGFSFETRYEAVLDEAGASVSLRRLAAVKNDTKRSFEDLSIALVFGDVRLVDEIGKLAGRKLVEGAVPAPAREEPKKPQGVPATPPNPWVTPALGGFPPPPVRPKGPVARPKVGEAGRYVCSVDDRFDMAQGETRVLSYLGDEQVPVQPLYRYDPDKHGGEPHLFWVFANTADNGLGTMPLAPGKVDIFERAPGPGPNLVRLGEANMPARKVDEEVELDLGAEPGLVVDRVLLDYQMANLRTDASGRVAGLDTRETYETRIRNRTGRDVVLEVVHGLEGVWELETEAEYGQQDNTVTFALDLAPDEVRTLTYTVITYYGTRTRGK